MRMVRCVGNSDTGLRRPNNEDAFLAREDLGIAALADGMGGAASGEIASATFINSITESFSLPPSRSEEEILAFVKDLFRSVNQRILTLANETPKHRGMGCTAELLVFHDTGYVLGHVGDSRTYLYREGMLQRLTRDHSVVQEQLEKGLIRQEDARRHAMRHVVLRAVGVSDLLAVDLLRGEVRREDRFLLCSDGLTDMAEESDIRDVIARHRDLQRAADDLVALAKAGGGHDNITVVLCEVMS